MKIISNLLVANRGEIACRVIRTAHRMGLRTVAVYSAADAQALHVRQATRAHALGGSAPGDSYLHIDKIIAAARACGADAVHPGYGFLSESAAFAQAVLDAGLVWVGPPPSAISQLGNKSRCKQLAQAHGVPCLPGYAGDDQSAQRFNDEALRIGFPVMVKAAAGGGGRGMRLVHRVQELAAALDSARSEAQAGFGSGELLLERALVNARHVEVQVFADSHGHCIHLGERDCSVQRRHQKLIEETPSPAVDAALREHMGRSAVQLAQAAGYVGAGTVEFLLSPAAAGQPAAYYLMEMNTRLQVEHPVTEAVTGLDLVEWQLRVAQGEPLPLRQEQVRFAGHAIEVRLCAEDENFAPHTGTVGYLRAPAHVRFDHALFEGLQVCAHYDSMLGKLIAHAPTRAQTIDALAGALDQMAVLGLATNRRWLAACLRHEAFRAGAADIDFVAKHGEPIKGVLQKEELLTPAESGLAALFGNKSASRLANPFMRPCRLRHRGAVTDHPVREADVAARPGQVAVALPNGWWHVQDGAIDVFVQDASYEPPQAAASSTGARPLHAPFNGKVMALHVAAGSVVAQGDTLLVLESMKLEHVLSATQAGTVSAVCVEPGQQVTTQQMLVRFDCA